MPATLFLVIGTPRHRQTTPFTGIGLDAPVRFARPLNFKARTDASDATADLARQQALYVNRQTAPEEFDGRQSADKLAAEIGALLDTA